MGLLFPAFFPGDDVRMTAREEHARCYERGGKSGFEESSYLQSKALGLNNRISEQF